MRLVIPLLTSARLPAASDSIPDPNLNTFIVKSQHMRLNSFHVTDNVNYDSLASHSGTERYQRLTSIKSVSTSVIATVDLAKGYHLMTYSPTGVEATAVELQDSARTLCRRNCKLYRLRSA